MRTRLHRPPSQTQSGPPLLRAGLQGESLLATIEPDGDSISDRMTNQIVHRRSLVAIPLQVRVLGVAYQQTPAFQMTGDTLTDALDQRLKVGNGRCRDRHEVRTLSSIRDVNSVEKKYVVVNIEIKRTAKPLNQRHCTGLCPGAGQARLLDEV